jgi:hypothetical protein
MSSPFQRKFSSKSPFSQTQPKGSKLIVQETATFKGEQVPVKAYIPGKRGTVSKVRGKTEELFPLLTDDQKTEISSEGYDANSLEGYEQYVKDYYAGRLPSQRKDFVGEVTRTPGTTEIELFPKPEGMPGEGPQPKAKISEYFKSKNDRKGFLAYLKQYNLGSPQPLKPSEVNTTPGTETYTGLTEVRR